MDLQSNQSEIARILQQIEADYLAAQRGLTGFAEGATHAAITARMEHMGLHHQDLQAIVGNDAIRLIAERLDTTPPNERKTDVLCHVWESLAQRKSSGPCLPGLQTGAREKAPGGGAAAFYLLLLSVWRVLPATGCLYSTPLLSIRKGMPSPFKRAFA